MVTEHDEIAVAIETAIDAHGLAAILEMISAICDEKADQLESQWQDYYRADDWRAARRAVRRAVLAATRGGC